MRGIFNFFRFFLGVFLLFFMIYFTLQNLNEKYCLISEINVLVDENNFITEELIVDYLLENKMHPDSIKLNLISFKSIEDLLLNHPQVKRANIYSDLDGDVFISIKQRKPICRVQDQKVSYYIDEDGKKMELSNNYTSRMLLVTGDINSVEDDKLFLILDYVFNNDFFRKQIMQIDINNSELLMLTKIGAQLEFGKIIDIYEKFEKLILYYEKGNTQNRKYKTLNLSYRNQIVCIK